MYRFQDPPYFLLVAGLLIGVACGSAFGKLLKQQVQEWSKTRSTRILAQIRGIQLLLPFWGIAIGICLFLASGLEVFGFPSWLSYSLSLPLTIFTSVLVWSQLSEVLIQLERGGSKALDLDAFE